MNKLICAAGVCLASFVATSALAGTPSAKFAATWTTELGLESVMDLTDIDTDTNITDPILVNRKSGYTLATIKVPQDKELLIGVSAEIGIVTDTSVKGQNGGAAKAIADGEAYVTVFAVPHDDESGEIIPSNSIEAAPGQIMLSKRVQALDATLGGVIQSCTDDDGDGTIVVADDCAVSDEEIGLLQDTTAAHHFNFVLPNMDQGVYDIKAYFTTGARASIDICDPDDECYNPDVTEGTVTASAYAKAIINKTMLTVQQVRAAKGSLQETEIIEP